MTWINTDIKNVSVSAVYSVANIKNFLCGKGVK